MARLLKILFALLLTLVVNGVGLKLLMRVNTNIVVHAPESEPVVTSFQVEDLPKPKDRPLPRRNVKRTSAPAPPLPIPNLPSSIEAPFLSSPKLDLATFIQPVFRQEMERTTQLIMSEEAVDEPPKLVRRIPPKYPARAEYLGTTGHVSMRLLVNREGLVERVIIDESLPPGVFDEAARQAVLQWRFSPATFRGERVQVWARQRIAFQLE